MYILLRFRVRRSLLRRRDLPVTHPLTVAVPESSPQRAGSTGQYIATAGSAAQGQIARNLGQGFGPMTPRKRKSRIYWRLRGGAAGGQEKPRTALRGFRIASMGDEGIEPPTSRM